MVAGIPISTSASGLLLATYRALSSSESPLESPCLNIHEIRRSISAEPAVAYTYQVKLDILTDHPSYVQK